MTTKRQHHWAFAMALCVLMAWSAAGDDCDGAAGPADPASRPLDEPMAGLPRSLGLVGDRDAAGAWRLRAVDSFQPPWPPLAEGEWSIAVCAAGPPRAP